MRNPTAGDGPGSVLLLQGPVGPFFKRLQALLNESGIETWRVCFNFADLMYAPRERVVRMFSGERAWGSWLEAQLADGRFKTVVLFGSSRPAHVIARRICQKMGVRVISLEEGYVRPGYITMEEGGNNADSPLAGRLPSSGDEIHVPAPDPNGVNLRRMGFFAATYYAVRGLTAVGAQRQLFHRNMTLMLEILYWTRNAARRIGRGEKDFRRIQELLELHDGRYYLVPLQVAADSNMGDVACGWNSARLISELIPSFARSAPKNARLVFKTHPMERGHNSLAPLIEDTAIACGVEDRVHVIDTGSIGLLTRHCAGMITINSTSGLSAIYHGRPLMLLGKAVYAHPALATCAVGHPDFDSWWSEGRSIPAPLRKLYLDWLKSRALAPGDFYALKGIEVACDSIRRAVTEGPRMREPVEELELPRKVGT